MTRRLSRPPALGDPGRPGVELGAQRLEGRLLGEGDIERTPVHRPQLGDGQADGRHAP